MKFAKLSGHFHALIFGLNTTFSTSKPITNLICVFISYTLQRLCCYNANYNWKTLFYWANDCENVFLNVFSTGNLLNSRVLWQSRACTKERKHAVYMLTQTFSTQFTTKDIDFLHFSSVSCQKHIKMNIEWIRMAIPVLIFMPVNRYNDKPCTGAEAYSLCHPLMDSPLCQCYTLMKSTVCHQRFKQTNHSCQRISHPTTHALINKQRNAEDFVGMTRSVNSAWWCLIIGDAGWMFIDAEHH